MHRQTRCLSYMDYTTMAYIKPKNHASELTLILFFTRGVSLKSWDKSGAFEREVALYQRLRPHVKRIAFFTYGNHDDLSYAARLDGIDILCNRWNLPAKYYPYLAPFLYWQYLRQADIFKTNQIEGSEIALMARRLFRKKMIARCGFMWSLYQSLYLDKHGANQHELRQAKQAVQQEKKAFTHADHAIITTEAMKKHVIQQYSLLDSTVSVIPNYVLTDVLKPQTKQKPFQKRLVFVGRFQPQKNLFALFDAIKGLDVELIMIGDGYLRPQLEKKAKDDKLNVQFLGKQSHEHLPNLLNEADVFIMPSHWEGHPKALLEAMSCGLSCIATNVAGNRGVITHGKNGILCGTSAAEIRSAIQIVMTDNVLRSRLGKNARDYVINHCSLEKVIELELELLTDMVTKKSQSLEA